MNCVRQIFVLCVTIALLFAPLPSFCAQAMTIQQGNHACCGDDAQLYTPSCCKDAAPATAMPTHSGEQVLSEMAGASVPRDLGASSSVEKALRQTHTYLPILRPLTILRT